MNRAWIGVPAVVLAGAWVVDAAHALPIAPPPASVVAANASPLLQVRYHRHHWHYWHHWHYRHYGYLRHRYWRGEGGAMAEQGAVKPGRWEFIAELQPPAGPQSSALTASPQTETPQSGGGIKTSYFGCITSDRAVPAEFGPQCRLDSTERNGPAITWSMTCTNGQGAVRSDGVAQYSGDTMEATMISHLPGGDGKVTDLTQHISGRYVGRCTQAVQ